MGTITKWPWRRSLAMASEGEHLKVKEILFGSLRDHLGAMGVEEGSTLECLGMDDAGVEVLLADGSGTRIERDYAWFIAVEPRFDGGREWRPE